ncbi:MAG: hypothetical protein WD314_10150 [Trueperaceae bacterium]
MLEGSTLRRPKPLLLLAYLSLEGPKSRRQLAELFWMDSKDPRDSLSTTIRRLNVGGQVTLLTSGDRVETSVLCDAVRFQQSANTEAPAVLLELYTGTFLDGIDAALGEEIEEWLYATRERLAQLARRAHLEMAATFLEAENIQAVALHAESALDVEQAPPWNFRELAEVTRLLQASDSPRSREAIRETREMGISLSHDNDPARRKRVEAVDLPRVGTSFVGRHVELAAIVAALATPHIRLLTLHGAGGVGKSRLAIEAARRAVHDAHTQDGAYFVALETVPDPTGVAAAIAGGMRLILAADRPPEQQVIQAIGANPTLLVLDNAEHLVDSRPFLSAILRQCPNARLLVTSRISLNLAEEHVVSVEGLELNSPSGEGAAVHLLYERMRQHGSLERLTSDEKWTASQVCRLLDGTPLAIELAAALTRVMPLSEIARELETGLEVLVNQDPTAGPRHRSLHAALDVSWNLLAAPEKRALARLSVFEGGFSRNAASAVAGVEANVLAVLIDASLLRLLPSGRYAWHPFIRHHVSLKLAERPQEEAVRKRHARYYLELVGSHDHDILGATAMGTALWIEEEFANLRSAWAWAVEQGDFDRMCRSAWPLVHFAEMRGRFGDVATFFEQAAAAHSTRALDEPGRRALGNILGCNTFLSFRLGRYEAALESGEASLDLLGTLQPRDGNWGVWAARQGLAVANAYLGRLDEGLRYVTENIVMTEADHKLVGRDERLRRIVEVMAGTSHETVAAIAIQGGSYSQALKHLGPAVRLLEPHGAYGLGYVYWSLGQAHLGIGSVAEAKAYLEEGLRFAHQTGFQTQVGYLLNELARVHLALGDVPRAESTCLEALGLALASGDAALETGARAAYGRAALIDGRFADARDRLVSAAAAARAYSCYPFAIEALEGLADLDVKDGRIEEAIRLLAFVKHSSFTLEAKASAAATSLRALKEGVPEAAFSAAYRQGEAATPEQAFSVGGWPWTTRPARTPVNPR